MTAVCVHPRCRRVVRSGSMGGRCAAHAHKAMRPCPDCAGARETAAARRGPRMVAGVMTSVVAVNSVGTTSQAFETMFARLPAPPWELPA